MLRRCLIVGAFGLVHGFGFSFILSQQLQFAGDHLLLSLLSFNFGVEIGQIAFLAVTLPLASVVLRQKEDRRMAIVIVCTLVAHVAWHWLSERWESLAITARPLIDDGDTASALHWVLLLAVIPAVTSVIIRLAHSSPRSAQRPKRMSRHG
jgi:uncharacterized membrane protein YhaH (DUF805 family)